MEAKRTVRLSAEVEAALHEGQAIVALESTVISHGLPWPENLQLASELENIVRSEGATPATIAIIKGQPVAGLKQQQLEALADGKREVWKISRRDFGAAMAQQAYGATTVAATMIVAQRAGIEVFATGGIGGVHRGDTGDVSADLPELSQTPVVVVCAGAKSILDLPRTLEWLETFGVPVIGYGTGEFPAFYTPHSGLAVQARANHAAAVADMVAAQWAFGLKSGVLVTVPIPAESALPPAEVEGYIQQALKEAEAAQVTGKDITPFLLGRLVEISEGKSLMANLALLRNNARVAAQIAVALATIRSG